MLKYAALLFNTVALLMYQFFFADGITITQNVPSTVKTEGEFTVELTINKGTVGGFAKLQQDLPEGFTATQDENSGASFTFSNQSVKFIWMSLPNDKEFKIKYKVKVAAGVSGDKVIGGKFSYVSDNVKQSIDVAPSTITVGSGEAATATTNTTTTTPDPVATNTVTTTTTPDPVVTNTVTATTTPDPVVTTTTTTPDPVVTTTTTTPDPVATTTSSDPGSVKCVRNVPGNPGTEFTVEVLINKGNVTGFAKLLETLPAGFTATAIESAGGSFSFSEQKVKYVWVSMPTQPEFKVTYKVTVAGGANSNQPIDGVFSYIENDETKKSIVSNNAIGGSQPIVNTTTTTPDPVVTTTTTTPDPVVTTTTTTTTPDPVVTNTTTTTTTPDPTANAISATNIPAPQGNVNYRVQIMALNKAVDANTLASRYNLNQKINTEMAEGFTKYTVGSHNEYKEARDAREDIKNKGVVGPFVTAYNSGKRITVQEALMITNQKWYR